MTKANKNYTLTGEHFYKFFQCPHWLWYDLYADQSKRGKTSPLIDMIYQDGLKHSREMLKSRSFDEIKPELFADLDEAFMATLELMKQGKNIYHGVLMDQHWVGMPDLLEARPGKSNFGDHYYVVYDIKNAHEIRDEYKFTLAFYSLILERLQGVLPKEAYIINADGEEKAFVLDDFLDQFHVTRESIERILDGQKPPPFLKSGCKRSPWYSLCLEETAGCNDVSLIYRLSQNDQRRLYDLGIHTVKDMAEADVDNIRGYCEDWPFDKILRFKNQAEALMTNKPLVLKKTFFPEVENEIYFDIESDPTEGIDYLLGLLIKKSNGETEYKYFLAKNKEDEQRIWHEFLDFLEKLDNFVIYHYAFYEREVFRRFASKYGVSRELEDKFKNNTIDLHELFIQAAILPIYFYSLKDIARFLGFNWRATDAGGAESVVWYNEWMNTGDKTILNKILQYNEDDVRATLYVKEWLAKQKPHTSKEEIPDELKI